MVVHHHRAEAAERAQQLIAWLEAANHKVGLPAEDAATLERPDLARPEKDLGDADLALSLGGDGSMLRTVGLVADQKVPVLGVNFGHLGYLTEVEPDEAQKAVERFFAGEHQVEHRQRVQVTIEGTDCLLYTSPSPRDATLSRMPSSA